MAELDIHSAIGASSERLLRKAEENIQLCQNFRSLCGLLADEGVTRGSPYIQIGRVSMTGTRMRAFVMFSKLKIPETYVTYPETNNLMATIYRENQAFYRFIQENRSLIRYLKDVVEHLDTYCRDKGKKFEEIEFSEAFMERDEDFVVLQIDDGEKKH
jgi:hypothetical protein